MKKIKYKLLCLAVFISIFLLVNSNTAQAVNINIITTDKREQIQLILNDYLNRKNIGVEAGNIKVDIGSSDLSPIQSALLFLCKDKNPIDCIKSLPIKYTNKVDTILKLADLESNGKAGLLRLIKTNSSWLADWNSIENGAVQNTELDEIDVYSSVNISDIKKFIQIYGMLPLGFIDKVDFKGKKIYQATGMVSKKGSTENISIEEVKLVSEIEKKNDYIFAFPTDQQKIYSPVTFYNVPDICGDGKCSLSENHQTCWHDCACPAGQVPARQGCINQTGVKLIIDDIKPDEPYCLAPNLTIKKGFENSSCQIFSPLDVNLHIENAPVNYSISPDSFFYEINSKNIPNTSTTTNKMFCIPKNFELSASTSRNLYNASEYQCLISPPKLYGAHQKVNSKSLLLGMYMNVQSKNGTQTLELTNTTSFAFKFIGEDFPDLEGLKAKVKKSQKNIDSIKDITRTIGLIIDFMKYILDALLACFSVVTILVLVGLTLIALGLALRAGLSWFFGIGEAFANPLIDIGRELLSNAKSLAPNCPPAFIISLIQYVIALEVIKLGLITIPTALCTGEAVSFPALGFFIPSLPKYAGGYTPEEIEIISADRIRQTGLSREVLQQFGFFGIVNMYSLMGLSIGLAFSFAAPGWSILIGFAVGNAVGLIVGGLMLALGLMCIDSHEAEDALKGGVYEAEAKKEAAIQKTVTNLVWLKGNVTGKSRTVCGNEDVKGFYYLEGFGCTDDLWFSFNGKSRPTCDFNRGKWVNENDKIFGDSCDPSNTTAYKWIVQNKSGENIGVRKYNATGIHKLFEIKADNLFTRAVNGSDLNIHIKCDGRLFGKNIESEFKLANYTEVCP